MKAAPSKRVRIIKTAIFDVLDFSDPEKAFKAILG